MILAIMLNTEKPGEPYKMTELAYALEEFAAGLRKCETLPDPSLELYDADGEVMGQVRHIL